MIPTETRIPLLHDHHTHPLLYAAFMDGLDLGPFPDDTREEAVARIRSHAAGPGWSIAYGWNSARYALAKGDFDDLGPLAVLNLSLHGLVVNDAGLVLFHALDPKPPLLPTGEHPLKDIALKGFPSSEFARVCFAADYDHADWAERGLAVVFARDDEKMILHNRPDLTAGPAEFAHDLPNGCPLRVHYLAPFVDDVADEVRMVIANEEAILSPG